MSEAQKAILDRDPILDYGDAGLMCFLCAAPSGEFLEGLDTQKHTAECTWAALGRILITAPARIKGSLYSRKRQAR
jgi:hypothetical protein